MSVFAVRCEDTEESCFSSRVLSSLQPVSFLSCLLHKHLVYCLARVPGWSQHVSRGLLHLWSFWSTLTNLPLWFKAPAKVLAKSSALASITSLGKCCMCFHCCLQSLELRLALTWKKLWGCCCSQTCILSLNTNMYALSGTRAEIYWLFSIPILLMIIVGWPISSMPVQQRILPLTVL